jgi:hypothetical protein
LRQPVYGGTAYRYAPRLWLGISGIILSNFISQPNLRGRFTLFLEAVSPPVSSSGQTPPLATPPCLISPSIAIVAGYLRFTICSHLRLHQSTSPQLHRICPFDDSRLSLVPTCWPTSLITAVCVWGLVTHWSKRLPSLLPHPQFILRAQTHRPPRFRRTHPSKSRSRPHTTQEG